MNEDAAVVARLQAGDEAAFVALVREYQPALLRLARQMVPSTAVAEEAVQETWIAVFRGVDRFEGRSSLKTWLFRILANRAHTIAGREFRSAPLPADELAERFDRTGAWVSPPVPWSDQADDRIVAERLAARVREMLPYLPAAQRQVLTLRDIEGLSATDVASVLGLSDANQRVLLHRARARLREQLDTEMASR